MNIVTTYPNITPLNLHPQVESAQQDIAQREVVPAVTQSFNSANGAEIGSNRDKERQAENRFSETSYDPSGEKTEDATYSSIVHGRGERSNNSDSEDADQQKSNTEDENKSQNSKSSISGEQLTDSEQQEVEELKARDTEVKLHENQHKNVGGKYAGSPSYTYERGPDGGNYATDGEVSISLSEESTPEETISKMRQVYSAALAPAEPSSQDRMVASEAKRTELKAQQEKNENEREENAETVEKSSATKDSSFSKIASETNVSNSSDQKDTSDVNALHQRVISSRYTNSWKISSSSLLASA